MGLISRVSSRTYRSQTCLKNHVPKNHQVSQKIIKSREFISSESDSSDSETETKQKSKTKVEKRLEKVKLKEKESKDLLSSDEEEEDTRTSQAPLPKSQKTQKSEKPSKKSSKSSSSDIKKSERKRKEKAVVESDDQDSSDEEPEGKKKSEKAKPKPKKRVKVDKDSYQVLLGGTGKKYARYNSFKGTSYLDIREMYEKEGKLLPGGKGISLKREIAELLFDQEIKDKVKENTDSLKCGAQETPKIAIGGSKINICCRLFKKFTLIDIREYYNDKKTDELKPGKKGISLNPTQWFALQKEEDNILALFEWDK